jgi:hypothetical protein
MELTCKEKIEILENNRKKFLLDIIDSMYNNFLEDARPDIILQLLNKMLKEVDAKPVTEISKFKIIVADIKKIDGETFINDNMYLLRMIGIDPVKDLDYNLRNKRKKYILNVLKGLVLQVGYTVENFSSSAFIDGEHKKVLKYMVKKNN